MPICPPAGGPTQARPGPPHLGLRLLGPGHLYGDLVVQAVAQLLPLQDVQQAGQLLLGPGIPLLALVRVGLVPRGDARLSELDELQAAEERLALGRGRGVLGWEKAEALQLYQAVAPT